MRNEQLGTEQSYWENRNFSELLGDLQRRHARNWTVPEEWFWGLDPLLPLLSKCKGVWIPAGECDCVRPGISDILAA